MHRESNSSPPSEAPQSTCETSKEMAGRQTANAPRALLVAALVTGGVTLLSVSMPLDYAGTAVGAVFFGVTYLLVLRADSSTIRRHGLRLGGVFEPEPLNATQIFSESFRALSWCLMFSLLFFPPFLLGFQYWFEPTEPFRFTLGKHGWDLVLANLLAIALPEEMFYRGYLQSHLESAWSGKVRVLGAEIGWGLLVSSAIFAVGHFTTTLELTRLSVFFPSLLFGWLRARTGGIGAAVLFHAACNIFSASLSRGYGFILD